MKFEKICKLAQCWTGSHIISYKTIYYEDGELSEYLITFENGYTLDLDRDDITEKDLKKLIKNKRYISIDFRLEVGK